MTESERSLVQDGFCSISELGEYLGVSRPSVYKLLNEGTLPYTRVLGRRRIPRHAVYQMVAKRLKAQKCG